MPGMPRARPTPTLAHTPLKQPPASSPHLGQRVDLALELAVRPDAAGLAHHLPALHIVALEAADEQAHIVARLPLIQLLLEHLHACGASGEHHGGRGARVSSRQARPRPPPPDGAAPARTTQPRTRHGGLGVLRSDAHNLNLVTRPHDALLHAPRHHRAAALRRDAGWAGRRRLGVCPRRHAGAAGRSARARGGGCGSSNKGAATAAAPSLVQKNHIDANQLSTSAYLDGEHILHGHRKGLVQRTHWVRNVAIHLRHELQDRLPARGESGGRLGGGGRARAGGEWERCTPGRGGPTQWCQQGRSGRDAARGRGAVRRRRVHARQARGLVRHALKLLTARAPGGALLTRKATGSCFFIPAPRAGGGGECRWAGMQQTRAAGSATLPTLTLPSTHPHTSLTPSLTSGRCLLTCQSSHSRP